MMIQWCPTCHWETPPEKTALFGNIFEQLGGDLFGLNKERVCPQCGRPNLLDVDKERRP